jgi:hypothetical protein
MQSEFETAEVNRGRPYKLWLELKLRNDVLNGSLIADDRRRSRSGLRAVLASRAEIVITGEAADDQSDHAQSIRRSNHNTKGGQQQECAAV